MLLSSIFPAKDLVPKYFQRMSNAYQSNFHVKKPEYKSIKDWQCAVVMSMDTSSWETDDGRPNIIVVHTKAALSKLFRFVPPTFRKAIRKLLQNFVAFCTMGSKFLWSRIQILILYMYQSKHLWQVCTNFLPKYSFTGIGFWVYS